MTTGPTAGIALKARHVEEALASRAAGLWFEVHAENYRVEGGRRFAMHEEIRRARPLSLHGVGVSLAGHGLPDPCPLAALKRLADRFRPLLVSDQLTWSRIGHRCAPNLFPFPAPARRRALSRVISILCRARSAGPLAISQVEERLRSSWKWFRVRTD